MITFQATPVLLVAAAVWVTWRMFIWRRRGGDLVRELGLALLLVSVLAIVSVTFFPLDIVLYDWHGSANFVPFASLRQLISEATPAVAAQNILGNITHFVPLGFLLPLLFDRMKRLSSFLWRIAVISVAIELLQIFTRARAVDVDDVILNTLGGAIGFFLFRAAGALLGRWERAEWLIGRLGASTGREPLLIGLVPTLATLGVVVPLMVTSINTATLVSGQDGVLGDAELLWPGSSVVASAVIEEHLYVLVHEGSFDPELLALVEYEQVLPGRYTRTAWGDMTLEHESQFTWSISAFNSEREEVPVVTVWGTNGVGAASLEIRNIGLEQRLTIPEGSHFAVGLPYDVERHQGLSSRLADFEIRFFDAEGREVTAEFEQVS